MLRLQVAVGDIVHRGADAGEVQACISLDGALFAVVEVYAGRQAVTPTSSSWVPSGMRSVWAAAELEQCVAWYKGDGGRITVLRM